MHKERSHFRYSLHLFTQENFFLHYEEGAGEMWRLVGVGKGVCGVMAWKEKEAIRGNSSTETTNGKKDACNKFAPVYRLAPLTDTHQYFEQPHHPFTEELETNHKRSSVALYSETSKLLPKSACGDLLICVDSDLFCHLPDPLSAKLLTSIM
ncbi:hypothetical protein BaRGS_00002050 [Batillaria attramentaria]|uniref:Uncharacterized protein n=1 Tax=Batillaria attramentaria TaxID=370345 RepID=A0ABD0M4J0_9CAEN